MRLLIFLAATVCFIQTSCKKASDSPKSKTDYFPIISAKSPKDVKQGEPIVSQVKCGFYEYFADITFLDFELKQNLPGEYQIRAKAFYKNFLYPFSLPVVSTIDTTLTIETPATGKYILKFYDSNKLIQTDTVIVN